MEVIARSRFIRRGPRKARLVADLVRGMRVEEALTALQFAPQHAAHDVAKTIRSAAANAEHNFELSPEELWLKTVMIDEGPTMKRIRPVSRGTAHQYFHRTCHITVIVEDREEEGGRRRRRAAPPRRAEPAPASERSIDEQAADEELEASAAPSPAVDEEVEAPEAEAAQVDGSAEEAVPTDAEVAVPGEADEDQEDQEDEESAEATDEIPGPDDEELEDQAPKGDK
ncbi:MAG: 50S ribosomal protein L22 [Candidatus Dormibacteraceae bacterium]